MRAACRRGNRDGGLRRRGEPVRGGAWRGVKQRAGLLELPATGVAPEAVVTYLGATGWEHVLEEATDELQGRQGRAARALRVVVAIAEGHLDILARYTGPWRRKVMPQSRGPWDKLQLVSGGIRKGSGQAESLSHPGAQAVAPETEALHQAGSWKAAWQVVAKV